MRTLGIDPGYDRCGVAVAERDEKGNDILVYSTCITPPKGAHAERLGVIVEEIEKLIATHNPVVVAIEKVFFSKNKKTALAVAEARGAFIATANKAGLAVHEYSPQDIKIAMTGYGASTKNQVISMVRRLVHVGETARYDDEFDAIAVALTHLATQ